MFKGPVKGGHKMPMKSRVRSHCPKCSGNLFPDTDRFGSYEQCLQCGYVRYLERPVASKSVAYADIVNPLPKLRDFPDRN